jgi:anthranilate synthase/aminodeoxychorismate synthase-like glutamine amidotransferase
MRLQYIDHYDSFSYNVIDWLQCPEINVEIAHFQYDEPGLLAKVIAAGDPVVLSPGPKSPVEVPQTLEIVERMIGRVPILGICLGHQILSHLAGFGIARCRSPRHGTVDVIKFTEQSCFYQPDFSQITAAVYNSLCVVETARIKPGWQVTGRSSSGEIHVVEMRNTELAPAVGMQFHPESFLTMDSHRIRECWFSLISQWSTTNPRSRLC